MPLTISQMLQGRYRIAARLGEGGMGAVYRAWDTRLHVSVAVKELIPQPGLDSGLLAQLRQQFEQEAVTLARLSHPNLVRVTDFFEEGGNAYLVMEFLEGESLADTIAHHGPVPEPQVLQWTTQLLDALAYCHEQGIVHRDIKPQNILLRPDGRAVLVDFGLVKLWNPRDPRTQMVVRGMGTPEYAPPEQYDTATGHTDARSDIYSLGATLYHALTGQAPPTATQRMANPRSFPAPRALNAQIKPGIEGIILKAMAIDMSERFQSAQAMRSTLAEVRAGKPPLPGNTLPGNTLPGNTLPGNTLPGNTLPGNTLPSPFNEPPKATGVPGVYTPARSAPLPQQPTPPPGWVQPYFPAPPQPAPATNQSRSKLSTGIIVLLGLGVLLCLGAGLTAIWGLFLRDDKVASSPTTRPTTIASPTPAATQQTLTVSADNTGDTTSLAEAVAAATPGSLLNIAAGTYTLQAPLEIDKPLKFLGAGMEQTIIVSSSPEAVIRYTGEGLFEARGITFRHEGDAEADVVYAERGEVLFDACVFMGAVTSENGAPRGGLHLSGTVTGRVENCTAADNDLDGFRLTEQAQVDLINNICRDNYQNGIGIRDNSGGEIRGNRCSGNVNNGIAITGDAAPDIVENTFSANGESGIAYWSNAAGSARLNISEENGLHGISVNGSATPTISDNTLRRNTETGLVYFGTSGGAASRNIATQNGLHGIGTNEQSKPIIEGNTCSNNTQVGMRLAGDSTPTVTQNTCSGNTLSGIIVTGNASVTLYQNNSSDNQESGLAYFENATGTVSDNEFWRNTLQGISINDNATPTIEDNLMAENKEAGLRISGDSRPTARNNEVHGHPLSGIIVRQNAQPTLESNNSYSNGESGLIYFGASGGIARYNTLTNNDLHGIQVKDDATPTLEYNTCEKNTEAGIAFFDRAGGVAQNNQINNNRWGIYVIATANPSLLNNTVENNATNIDDRR
ncbi:MAG: right-handed parallel beta-helix repeat-containing protein [Anaerolineae bacterium]|nr:right-handed parallel beta-helix repeat-containing protein [Anaerolineae bacterium]